MFGRVELLIDFGSKKIAIYKKNAGLILKEPSVIIASNAANRLKLVAAGKDAVAMIGRTSITEQIVNPIKGGLVDNDMACKLMISDFIDRILPNSIFRPNISAVLLVSCGLTANDKRAIESVFTYAGVKDIILIESPLAIAAGVGNSGAAFVVDIGGNKTEIAIVNNNSIVAGCSIDIGGDDMNEAIIDYIADKYRMIIHHNIAEKVKLSLATMRDNDISQLPVTARSIPDNGESRTITVNAKEIRSAISPIIDKIAQTIEDVSLMLPDSLAEEIFMKGITMCGGCAAIPMLDKYLYNKIHIKFNLLDRPDESSLIIGSVMLNDKDLLTKLINS